MQSAIAPFSFTPQSKPEELWVGPVRYVDLTQIRIRDSGIKRCFYKHVVFESEREFRLALNLEFARLFTGHLKPEGVSVSVDPKLFVERVILGPCLPEKERDQISKYVHEAGLVDRLANSILLGQPRYI